MKYIDVEKLIASLEREIESSSKGIKPGKSDEKSTFCRGEISALYTIKHLIASLQQEQPSLPSNLDEAAIDAAQLDMQDRQIMEATNDERLRYSRIFRRGFKAGAEWMAGQIRESYNKND